MPRKEYQKTHILLADDDRQICRLFMSLCEEAFRDDTIHFTTVHDGRPALSKMRESRPDLVVIGNQMPKLDGVEVVRTMAQEEGLNSIPTLLTSGAGIAEDLTDLGMNLKFLLQPMGIKVFEAAVQELRSRS